MNKYFFIFSAAVLALGQSFAQDAYSGASFGTKKNRVQYAPIPSDVDKDFQAIKVSLDVAGVDVTTGPTLVHFSDGENFRIYGTLKEDKFIKVSTKGNKIQISAIFPTEAEAIAAPLGKAMKKGKNLGARPPKPAPVRRRPAARPQAAAGQPAAGQPAANRPATGQPANRPAQTR